MQKQQHLTNGICSIKISTHELAPGEIYRVVVTATTNYKNVSTFSVIDCYIERRDEELSVAHNSEPLIKCTMPNQPICGLQLELGKKEFHILMLSGFNGPVRWDLELDIRKT